MPFRIVRPLLAVLVCLAAGACQSTGGGAMPQGSAQEASSIAGREWRLVELGGRPAAAGAGGRAATLRLEGERASGFAGCNGFSGGYQMSGSGLTFSTLVSTRMACDQGMELERDYLAALEATRTFRLTPGGLELLDERGVRARFTAQ